MAFVEKEDLDLITIAGFALNVEEKAALFASLLLKKEEEKLANIYLWGKILGIQKDYIIAQSVAKGNFFERKYFYS